MKRIILTEKDFFSKRILSKIMFLFLILVLGLISGIISGFSDISTFLSIPEGIIWLFSKFIPSEKTLRYLPKIVKPAIDTILLSVTSTLISSVLAMIMAVIGSETTGVSKFAKMIVKAIASFFRNMPLVAWSLILLFSFKQSQLTGLLALTSVTFGYLTRSFTETIDEVAGNVIEALEATGATWGQIIFQGVIPSVSSQLVSWILYYTENSIREATLVGMLTGTGIGFVFNLYYRSFRYDAVGMVILVVVIIVVLIELLSNKIRKELL